MKDESQLLPVGSSAWYTGYATGYAKGVADALTGMSAETIDIQAHRGLPKAVHGAIVNAIDAHGPLTRANASSATKRVLAAIKVHNRQLRIVATDRQPDAQPGSRS